MNVTDDFFFNATLSCYKGTKLYGYDQDSITGYEKSLKRTLSQSVSSVEYKKDAFVDLNWKIETRRVPWDEDTIELPLNFLYIRCTQSLYRLCLVVWDNGVLILANSSPAVLQPCLHWLTTHFDCIIKPLHISQSTLRHEYNEYLIRSIRESGMTVDSQLIFAPATKMHQLQKITIGVRGEDVPKFYEVNEEDITVGVFEHLSNYTGIDFDQLDLIRVNCGGFVMTSNGKIKLFRRGYNLQEMWNFVSELLKISRFYFKEMED